MAGTLIEETKATIILVFASDRNLLGFTVELLKHNVTGKTWMASEAWVSSSLIAIPSLSHIFHGTIGFALRRGIIPGFQELLMQIRPPLNIKSDIGHQGAAQLKTQRNDFAGVQTGLVSKQLLLLYCRNVLLNSTIASFSTFTLLNTCTSKYMSESSVKPNISTSRAIFINTRRKNYITESTLRTKKRNLKKDSNSNMPLSPESYPSEIKSFIHNFWETQFNCTWNMDDNARTACTGVEKLDRENGSFTDVSQIRVAYNVYLAVYSFAHALQNLSECLPSSSLFINNTCPSIQDFKPWQVSV